MKIDRGRHWSDASAGQGAPRTAGRHQKVRRGTAQIPSEPQQPCRHLDFRLLAPEVVTEYIPVVLSN